MISRSNTVHFLGFSTDGHLVAFLWFDLEGHMESSHHLSPILFCISLVSFWERYEGNRASVHLLALYAFLRMDGGDRGTTSSSDWKPVEVRRNRGDHNYNIPKNTRIS